MRPAHVVEVRTRTTIGVFSSVSESYLLASRQAYGRLELIGDGVIHAIGLAITIAIGGFLVAAGVKTAPGEWPMICIYVGSLLVIFQSLATVLEPDTLLLLVAGGVAYSSGIIFHLWERLRFHNVIWHCFVVARASIHLWAVLDCMVLQRL